MVAGAHSSSTCAILFVTTLLIPQDAVEGRPSRFSGVVLTCGAEVDISAELIVGVKLVAQGFMLPSRMAA